MINTIAEEMARVQAEAQELDSVINTGLANATIVELKNELQRRLDDCDSELTVMLVNDTADTLAFHIKNDMGTLGTKYEQALKLAQMIIDSL